jgi:hypothetical protein
MLKFCRPAYPEESNILLLFDCLRCAIRLLITFTQFQMALKLERCHKECNVLVLREHVRLVDLFLVEF